MRQLVKWSSRLTAWAMVVGLAGVTPAGDRIRTQLEITTTPLDTSPGSNCAILFNYPLRSAGTEGSHSGINLVSLPYRPFTSWVFASDIWEDLLTVGTDLPISISRFDPTTDTLQTYTGLQKDNFPIKGGEGYLIQVREDANFLFGGGTDPGREFLLAAQGTNGSRSGTNDFGPPWAHKAPTASALRDEINFDAGGPAVVSISRFDPTTDTYHAFTGLPEDDFNLGFSADEFGRSYRIVVNRDVVYRPRSWC